MEVLFENSEILVVNKPEGWTVHNEEPSVMGHLQKAFPGKPFHLLHRLDRETSGVLAVAKSSEVASRLMPELEKRTCRKLYQAILRGSLPESDQWNTWNWPLTDKAEGRKSPQGAAKDRKSAESIYRVLRSNMYFSWVEVEIKTGRQHQIRKHAALARHPIVGDNRYNDGSYNQKISERYASMRMFLHATQMELPFLGEVNVFTAPIPESFRQLFPSGS